MCVCVSVCVLRTCLSWIPFIWLGNPASQILNSHCFTLSYWWYFGKCGVLMHYYIWFAGDLHDWMEGTSFTTQAEKEGICHSIVQGYSWTFWQRKLICATNFDPINSISNPVQGKVPLIWFFCLWILFFKTKNMFDAELCLLIHLLFFQHFLNELGCQVLRSTFGILW